MDNSATGMVRKILTGVGLLILIPGAMAVLSLFISIFFHEHAATKAFLLTAAICALAGAILTLQGRKFISSYKQYSLFEAMCIATVGWFAVAVAGALPLLFVGKYSRPEGAVALAHFSSFVNCLFEASSGFTSTGLSMVKHPGELPHAIQWWRSFMQWVGGVGLIVYISLLLGPNLTMKEYYKDHTLRKALPTIDISFRQLGTIYLTFTFISILLIYFQGIPFWEALNHGLTSIATGGFTMTENGIRHYSPALKLTIMGIMVFAALNFNVYSKILRTKNLLSFVKNVEVVGFLLLLAVGIAMLYLDNNHFLHPAPPLLKSAFQLCSALATAGFQTAQIKTWSPMALVILSFCMIIGGNSSSTTSGIKTYRLIGLLKGAYFFMASIFYPEGSKLSFNIGNQKYSEKESVNIFTYISVFLVVYLATFFIFIGVFYYTLPDKYPLSLILFEGASTFNNVGLSTGITGPGLPFITKMIMIIAMVIGRIELVPLYVLSFLMHGGRRE